MLSLDLSRFPVLLSLLPSWSPLFSGFGRRKLRRPATIRKVKHFPCNLKDLDFSTATLSGGGDGKSTVRVLFCGVDWEGSSVRWSKIFVLKF